MANNLTGDYDAVFQISTQQINGILAAMHQSRIDPNASPTFPHSTIIRIGDLALLHPWAVQLTEFLGNMTQRVRASEGMVEQQPLQTFYTRSLPEVSNLYKKAFSDLGDALRLPSSGKVRGTAYVQVSTPTITLRGGATTEITVHVDVRAQFVPDSGAATLPEPIHGEVQANYVATTRMIGSRRVVHVKLPSQDDQIQFYPAAGINLTAAEVDEISAEIRKALRKDFAPTDVEIPADFPVSEFIALGSGPSQAIALPLQLSDSSAGGDINSITNQLLGTSEFAIAVSKEYVGTRFQDMIDKMKAYASGIQVTYLGATYSASVAYLNITWKTGTIDISGKIDITTPAWYAPNGWITFTQTVALELDVPSQTFALKAVGDPSVNESWWLPHGKALNAVRNARDSALPGASQSINGTFGNARNQLINGLRRFDKYADVRYLTVEITPDGIIARGIIDCSSRLDPVVHFEETPDRTSFTAFRSWIPGGTIDSFQWTWQTGAAWFSLVGSSSDAHRFTITKPPGIVAANQICLRINGTRITADGFVENVTAGETCKPSWSEPVLVHPSWWMKVMIPIWWPDPPNEIPLEDAVLGYINVAGQSRDPGRLATNTLVHFTDARLDKPLDQLGQATRQSRKQDGSLLMILVLPTGTLRQTRRQLEASLGTLDERFAGHLIITEDYLGGWTKIFSVRETPSTFFLNARREFVWQHAGKIDARALAAALEEHMVPAPAAAINLMQLNVRPGDFVPDAQIEDDHGEITALHQLRGQRVIINFWQSWAKPCVNELQNLQRLSDQKESAPFILAINGGEDRSVIEEVRQKNNLTFSLIHDPDQALATLFDVQCWPTTVSVSREGIIDRVQFGFSPRPREAVVRPKD